MSVLIGIALRGLGFWMFFHQIWNLRRAATEGLIHIRKFNWDYQREEDPFLFWATSIMSLIFLLFGLAIGLGGFWLILDGIFLVQ